MNLSRPSSFSALRLFLLAFVAVAGATAARAQFELSDASYTRLFQGTLPNSPSNTPPVLTPQYASAYSKAGGVGPVSTSATLSARYPSQIYVNPVTLVPTGAAIVMVRATVGVGFAGGVPRYLLGDTIMAPGTQIDAIAVADAAYWRPQPVEIGEAFIQPLRLTGFTVTAGGSGYASAPAVTFNGGGGSGATATVTITGGAATAITLTNAGSGYTSVPTVAFTGGAGTGAAATVRTTSSETPLPLSLASVAVTNGGTGYTSAPTVTFSGGGGAGAVATATVTQGVVTGIIFSNTGTGYTSLPGVTLSGGGGTGATAVAAGPPLPFYYSPHAERVFASQAGRVAVTWVTRTPVATATDSTPRFRFREDAFTVSSTTSKPVRTIFWTERSFSGPIVNVPAGNIETANPIYNALMPATVAVEYKPVGVSVTTDPAITAPAEKSTIWFEKTNGIGQLRTYNAEGRILVEYLGKLKTGSSNVHTFLGADIVEIVRVAPTINTEVNLGERLLPRDADGRALPLDGSSEWLAAPVASLLPDGQAYYGTLTRPDGVTEYYAERENTNPDRVIFYWLERADASLTAETGSSSVPVNLLWPKAKNAYAMSWPTGLAAYAHNTVGASGSTVTTGIQFAPGQLPQVVFQDDSAQTEAKVDVASQRFVVTFPGVNAGDGLNRTLLRFTNGAEVWYARLYTQADTRAGFQQADGATSTFTATLCATI